MAKDDVFDRVELCDSIISLIQNVDETQAYILYSGAGVGKSSVSKKISKLVVERNINKDIIRIISMPNTNEHEGAFLKNIFHAIRKYYLVRTSKSNKSQRKKYIKYSYNYYVRHQNFAALRKFIEGTQFNTEDCKNVLSTIFQFIKLVVSFIMIKLNLIDDLETNFNDEKILTGYIKYIFKKENIVLCVENSQNFDRHSLENLIDILIETKTYKNYFLFEFTLTENSENLIRLEQLKNELDYSEITYKISELTKLEIKYVLELAKKHCNSSDASFILEIEQIYTGNLKKVENFAFNYSAQTINDADPTLVLLQALSQNQKYILSIILLNNAAIAEDLLRKVLQNSNGIYYSNYNEDIKYLMNNVNLVEKRDKHICIADIDTIESWNKNSELFKMYDALAYRNCEAIFSRILQSGVEFSLSRKDCILLLFRLYNKFEPVKLNNILNLVDEVICDIISIEDLKKYIENLINILYINETSLDILYNIFDICNRYQLVELESFCLDKISKISQNTLNEKYLFCYYTNLLQKEEYEFLLNKISELEDDKLSVEFKYYIALFKIVAYTSLNRKEDCQVIIDNLGISTQVQYGYFLRLAEAYDKRNVAIPKVEKSVSIFKEINLDIQAAKSQVSLLFLYSITGKLDKAENALNAAEKILLKNIENRHVFSINKACLYLLNRNYTKEVWDLLNSSEKYAYTRFDKIAIIINKLIWCIENQAFSKGRYYEKKGLELLELEYNHHLHAIFYYNCFVLYNAMNETSLSQKYYKLAVKYKDYCDTLKARLENKTEVEDQTTFLLQYPWHVCFVSYWYFDYIIGS